VTTDGLPDLELFQFPSSHYNEKARWGLDWKGLPHRRTSLLPGPHAPQMLWLTGQTKVPALLVGDRIICGSARILAELERLAPDPPLLPEKPEDRDRELALQVLCDNEIAPGLRRAAFHLMLDHLDYVCRTFAGDRPPLVLALYRAILPGVRIAIRRSVGLTDEESVREGFAAVQRGLDCVVAEAGPDGYLVGDAFSIADLTAASILAPVADPPGSPMARPRPMPEPTARYLEEISSHPGVAWVRRMYARHRPESAETQLRASDSGSRR